MNGDFSRLKDFWSLVEAVWESSAFGINLGHLLSALAIVIVFWMVRGLFAKVVLANLRGLAKKTATPLDDKLLAALDPPLAFIPIVIGLFFAVDFLNFQEPYDSFARNIISSLIAFVFFWALYRCVTPLAFVLEPVRRVFNATMAEWLMNAFRILFIFLGAATILELWGIKVWPLITGLGLFGVAVALGAQDMFKNLISGLLVIAEGRFNPGDWIKVDGVVEGTVERINFRSTTVRRFDKAPVQVPNAKLSDNAVTNFSQMTYRRIKWVIGVEYGTTVDQLRQIRDNIEAYITSHEEFVPASDAVTFVRIDAFSDSAIDIMLYCFTRTTKWGEWLEIKERLAYAVKDIVEGAGSSFAFPSRSLYLETMPEDMPEIFQPPGEPELRPAASA